MGLKKKKFKVVFTGGSFKGQKAFPSSFLTKRKARQKSKIITSQGLRIGVKVVPVGTKLKRKK